MWLIFPSCPSPPSKLCCWSHQSHRMITCKRPVKGSSPSTQDWSANVSRLDGEQGVSRWKLDVEVFTACSLVWTFSDFGIDEEKRGEPSVSRWLWLKREPRSHKQLAIRTHDGVWSAPCLGHLKEGTWCWQDPKPPMLPRKLLKVCLEASVDACTRKHTSPTYQSPLYLISKLSISVQTQQVWKSRWGQDQLSVLHPFSCFQLKTLTRSWCILLTWSKSVRGKGNELWAWFFFF